MNTNTIVSLPVGEDLSASAKLHISVKLTSTGIKAAGILDLPIGTLMRGNDAPAAGQTVGTAGYYPPGAVHLRNANGFTWVKLGANGAAIAMGDELERGAGGTWINKPTAAAVTGAITGVFSTGIFTSGSVHNLGIGNAVRLVSQTGGVGLAAGNIFFVRSVPSTTTFTLSAVKGGLILGTSADVTYWTATDVSAMVLQHVGDGFGNVTLAIDAAPITSTDGQIRALQF